MSYILRITMIIQLIIEKYTTMYSILLYFIYIFV